MLTFLHSIFDPNGMLIPFTLTGKELVQLCWKLGLGWKVAVPVDVQEQWKKWEDQVRELEQVRVPRTIRPGPNPEKNDTQLPYLQTLLQTFMLRLHT